MKNYFLLIPICVLVNAKAPAQSSQDYFKSVIRENNLTKWIVKNDLNPYSHQSKNFISEKTETVLQKKVQDFCSNIAEIVTMLKNKKIRNYFLDIDNETKDYIRYNSEKNWITLLMKIRLPILKN
jgi:hypothetical protein